MAETDRDGFPTITPHLVVKRGAEAIEFYKKAFGAEERFRMPWRDASGEERIGHAELRIGDAVVMLADEAPQHGAVAPSGKGASVMIHLKSPDVDATLAKAVAAGATITMPAVNAFWGDRYGKLVDPFGHHWSVATKVEDLTPEEINERAAKALAEGCRGE